jgi:hypothetical protein
MIAEAKSGSIKHIVKISVMGADADQFLTVEIHKDI